MKKIIFICLATITLLAINNKAFADVGVPLDRCGTRDMKHWIEFGQERQAIECAQNYTKRNSGDAEAYYLWGVACLKIRDYQCVNERFSPKIVQQAYGREILSLFENPAISAIGKGNWEDAKQNFSFALRFGGNGSNYADKFFNACASALSRKDTNTGLILAQYTIDFNPNLADKLGDLEFMYGKEQMNIVLLDSALIRKPVLRIPIADFYYAQYAKSLQNGKENLAFLKKAGELDPKRKRESEDKTRNAGEAALKRALELAKKANPTPAEVEELELKKTIARANLPAEVMERELPEVVKYASSPTKYSFSLKAGEQLSSWAEILGRNNKSTFFSEKECRYDVLYADGYIAKKGENVGPEHPSKFKLRAYTDCTVNGGIDLLVE